MSLDERVEFEQVLLNNIDLSSEIHDRFLLDYGQDTDDIMNSIKEIGLINPVILIKENQSADGTYRIVCGYRRIMACRNLGWESIKAQVVDVYNEEEILLFSLHDNLFSRGFNVIEKAITLKKFLEIGYSNEKLITEIVPFLGLPPKKEIIKNYISILEFNDEIKHSIIIGELELEKAFLLLTLNDGERDVVYRFLFRESLTNINEAKETIRNLLDLKMMKQLEIADMLSSDEINQIFIDKKSNKRQKGEKIYRLVKSLRYPAISMKEDEFDKSCMAMRLDNNVRINHSRYFEGDEIRITLKSSNEEKLRSSLERLITNVRDGSFKKIFSLFK